MTYELTIAIYPFFCPITGIRVRRGDICLKDKDGDMFHVSLLPKRKLKPLNA